MRLEILLGEIVPITYEHPNLVYLRKPNSEETFAAIIYKDETTEEGIRKKNCQN